MFSIGDIKHLINPAVERALSQNNFFSAARRNALDIINKTLGSNFTESSSPSPADTWLALPFAWLVEFFTLSYISNPSDEFRQRAEFKYSEAVRLLKSNANANPARPARCAEIEGMIRL
jgi:hypothetical protein